jgi:hypothetical protein
MLASITNVKVLVPGQGSKWGETAIKNLRRLVLLKRFFGFFTSIFTRSSQVLKKLKNACKNNRLEYVQKFSSCFRSNSGDLENLRSTFRVLLKRFSGRFSRGFCPILRYHNGEVCRARGGR